MRLKKNEYIVAAFFAGLTAIGAFLRIPAPVVPFNLQVLAVLLSGLVLGSRGGALAQTVYLLLGLSGLPVFSGGGGIAYILSPTFGYLLSYIPCAWTAGRIARRGAPSLLRYGAASAAGLMVVYAVGTAVLFLNLNYIAGKPSGILRVFQIGVLPFLWVDLLKGACASLFAFRLRRLLPGEFK